MKRVLGYSVTTGSRGRVRVFLRTADNILQAYFEPEQVEYFAKDLLCARFDTHPPEIFRRPKNKRAGHQNVWLMAKFRDPRFW
jgi:hypothetical protein